MTSIPNLDTITDQLNQISFFYSPEYPNKLASGVPDFYRPKLELSDVDKISRYFNKIGKSNENFLNTRYKILQLVKQIPSRVTAFNLYEQNINKKLNWLYEDYQENYLAYDDIKSKLDIAIKSGFFQTIEDYESSIEKLCNYFEIDRQFVGSDINYKNVNFKAYRNGYEEAKQFLIREKYVSPVQITTLDNLILGKPILEPLMWLKSASELRRFISSLYRHETGIPWQEVEKLFLVDNNYPKNLKSNKPRRAIVNQFDQFFPPFKN